MFNCITTLLTLCFPLLTPDRPGPPECREVRGCSRVRPAQSAFSQTTQTAGGHLHQVIRRDRGNVAFLLHNYYMDGWKEVPRGNYYQVTEKYVLLEVECVSLMSYGVNTFHEELNSSHRSLHTVCQL